MRLKNSYQDLGDNLIITSYGYEDSGYIVPIQSVDEYLENKDRYYNECVILPDGRVIEASPSHTYVGESLVNFLAGERYVFSPTWLVEERLYLTKAIYVWESFQTTFDKDGVTEEQLATLLKIADSTFVEVNLESFEKEKIEYFLEQFDSIREEAIEWTKRNRNNF
mgnify:CR=1 FL=1